MSAPPFRLVYEAEAKAALTALRRDATKHKKVQRAIKRLRDEGPGYRSLNSHKYSSLVGPNGEEVWESYVENHTPGAWRIWWIFGPGEDTISIVAVGKHP